MKQILVALNVFKQLVTEVRVRLLLKSINPSVSGSVGAIKKALFLWMTFFALGLRAQSGLCTDGTYIKTSSYINLEMHSAGDLSVTGSGAFEIGPSGIYNVYGAIDNAGTITIDNGGVLNIYGDIYNSGTITVNVGGTINFYGEGWTGTNSSTVNGQGDIYFTSDRPDISSSWQAAVPCLSSFSGGSFSQNLDGGGLGVDMDIKLHINNPQNLVLTGTSSVAGDLIFDVNDGDLILGNNDLVITSGAAVSGYGSSRLVVTSGTGHMVKEGLASSSAFFFPVGRAEGDYTPADIVNMGGASDNFYVQVKDYSESAADEADPARGMDRTWNIYSDNGSGATIALQHNSSTNNAGDYTTQGGDANAFVTQYLGVQWSTSNQRSQGFWQTGAGGTGTYATGSVAGSSLHYRSYSATATSATSNSAYFSKSSNGLTPLPVTLLDFNAQSFGSKKVMVSWKTTEEINQNRFDIFRLDAEKQWIKIGEVRSAGQCQSLCEYQFVDQLPQDGTNHYRLGIVNHDGQSSYSPIRSVVFNVETDLNIYPNPSNGTLNIISNNAIEQVWVFDLLGHLVYTREPLSEVSALNLDLSHLPGGVYQLNINGLCYRWVKF